MNRSDTLTKFAPAFLKLQTALGPVKKTADNPFFKSKYADLLTIWNTIHDTLTEHGFAVAQGGSPTGKDNAVCIETMLIHESGEFISGEVELPLGKADPQGAGSAITYGRRYGLSAILGLVTEEDDDGNAASFPPASAPARQAPAPPARAAAAAAGSGGGSDWVDDLMNERDGVKKPASNPGTGVEFPANPVATTLADMITTKQLGMVRAVAREAGVDADEECAQVMKCTVTELSRKGASALIDHLRALGEKGAPFPSHAGPTEPVSAPAPQRQAAPPARQSQGEAPSKPPQGRYTDAAKAASAKQLKFLATIAEKNDMGVLDLIHQEFTDVEEPSQLSKWACSYIIDTYNID